MQPLLLKTTLPRSAANFISKFLIYFFLIVITACMLLPFCGCCPPPLS